MEITVTRTYIVTIDDDQLEEVAEVASEEQIKDLADAITRLADQGDLMGQMYLVDTADGKEWTDDYGDNEVIVSIDYEVDEEHVDVTGA